MKKKLLCSVAVGFTVALASAVLASCGGQNSGSEQSNRSHVSVVYKYGDLKSWFTTTPENATFYEGDDYSAVPTVADEYKDAFLGWYANKDVSSATPNRTKLQDLEFGADLDVFPLLDYTKAPGGLYDEFLTESVEMEEMGEMTVMNPVTGEMITATGEMITAMKRDRQTGIQYTPWSDLKTAGMLTVENGTLSEVKQDEFRIGDKIVQLLSGTLAIDSEVRVIGKSAFTGDYGYKVTVPSSVEEIQERAFNTALTKIDFAENSNCTTFGEYAFRNCGVKNFVVPKSVTTLGKNVFQNSRIENFSFEEGTTIEYLPDEMFVTNVSPDNGFTKFTVPASVKELGNHVFNGRSNLKTVTFETGSALEKIGDYAFNGCTNLTKVEFDKNSTVTSLGDRLFENCEKLKEIYIPNGIISTKNTWFKGCSGLETVTFSATVQSCMGDTFNECPKIKEYVVDESNEYLFSVDGNLYCHVTPNSEEVYMVRYAVGKTDQMVIMPQNVRFVSNGYCFYATENLKGVVLPNGIGLNGIRFDHGESVTTIFYSGTKDSWDYLYADYVNMYPSAENYKFDNVDIYYLSPEKPTDTTEKYWRYEDGKVVVWNVEE